MPVLVYEHWRPDLNLPFYVGHGSKRRAYGIRGRTVPYSDVISELKRLGLQRQVRLVSEHPTEVEACDAETSLIRAWRAQGVVLVNVFDDYDKVRLLSPEGRARIREAGLGRVPTPEDLAKRSATLTGRILSAGTRARMRAAKLGKKQSPELIAARSRGMMGHTVSQETRARIGVAKRNPQRDGAIARGEKRYFTGQPCSKGHVAERYVCDNVCVECAKEKLRRRRR